MTRDLTIGEFAALTHLTVRMLRRYHDAGLLEPARVSEETGYRYYAEDQIATAQVIHRLRQLDVPLAEVADILRSAPANRGSVVGRHLARLENELERTSAAVASLRELLRPDVDKLKVKVRTVPARHVAAVSGFVTREDVVEWYGRAAAELDAGTPVGARVGALGGRYDNDLFSQGAGRVMVFREMREFRPSGHVEAVTLPQAELATVVHKGTHDDIDVTYGRLGSWVVRHALSVAGQVEETYLVGPADDPDPASWRTSIGWPVFRLADDDTAEPVTAP